MLDFEKVRQASSAGTAAVTATCGSGMTAAVIWLAMRTLGIQTAIYDESWMVSESCGGESIRVVPWLTDGSADPCLI